MPRVQERVPADPASVPKQGEQPVASTHVRPRSIKMDPQPELPEWMQRTQREALLFRAYMAVMAFIAALMVGLAAVLSLQV